MHRPRWARDLLGEDDPYFRQLRDAWSKAPGEAQRNMPVPAWGIEAEPTA